MAFQVNNQQFGISKYRLIQSNTRKLVKEGIHIFANQNNQQKGVKHVSIFHFARGIVVIVIEM